MVIPIATLVAVGLALGNGSLGAQSRDSAALAAAITHARTVIPEGAIQLSPDTVPPGVRSKLEAAARVAGFAFGRDDEAVRCGDHGACVAIGPFRGLVHVVEYQRSTVDRVVVTLRMLRFTPEADALYEQVDEVHVGRSRPEAHWQIVKVIRVTES